MYRLRRRHTGIAVAARCVGDYCGVGDVFHGAAFGYSLFGTVKFFV